MYAIDADVFIQAKNRHYGFDFCPAFWDWLDEAHAAGRVGSVEKIAEELKDGDDELADWARARDGFFLEADDSVVGSLQLLSVWAAGGNYRQAAVAEFLASGDYYLIAQAHADGLTVVTHEVSSPGVRKIKIPKRVRQHERPVRQSLRDAEGRASQVRAGRE
jgi:Domain of unknown function (DUF4411)